MEGSGDGGEVVKAVRFERDQKVELRGFVTRLNVSIKKRGTTMGDRQQSFWPKQLETCVCHLLVHGGGGGLKEELKKPGFCLAHMKFETPVSHPRGRWKVG